jgi:biotin carboxylase
MAHLLIMELPGGNDTDILQAAIERGDEFTFLSAQLSHYRAQAAVQTWLDQALECVEVAPFDYASVEQKILALHRAHPFDALLCLQDIRLVEAAQLAHTLHLKYLNPESAQLLRDKYQVRCRLQSCGIEQPEFALATTNQALQAAVAELGLPVLIKPADGYGSQNVVVLRFDDDLDPWMSPLQDMLPSRADYGLGVKANDRLLVERYMHGEIIGCDTFTHEGQHTLLGVNEKLMFEPPSFAIRGGCFTPNQGQFKTLEKYVFRLLDAVNFNCGAAHIEIMLTEHGPRLIEINPRLVGAKIARLMGLALGQSVHQALIELHLGAAWQTHGQPAGVAVTRWLVADRQGLLYNVAQPPSSAPEIRNIEILKQAGDALRPPMENADRIGYVMSCAPDKARAQAVAEHFIAGCSVNYAPEPH